MEQIERIVRLHHLLSTAHYPIARKALEDKLECSAKTIRRDLDFLRDRLGAPLDYDSEQNGWFYHTHDQNIYELPGFWLNEEEIHALLSIQQLLTTLAPGFLSEEIAPFEQRIRQLLGRGTGTEAASSLTNAIRLLSTGQRKRQYMHFQAVASATLQKQRIHVTYHGRRKNMSSERDLSPLRLLHYKENWYLKAWCHQKDDFRMFSLDKFETVKTLHEPIIQLKPNEIEHSINASFGIFTGNATDKAILQFNEEASRWVADEVWHPEQTEQWLDDGSFVLSVPYHDETELSAEILRYGEDVMVKGPESLKERIIRRLTSALDQYHV